MVNNDQELNKYKNHLEQLKRVQEAGKVGYWAVYVDKEFLEWSAETYKLFDISFGKPVTYEDMLTYVHPDDKARIDEKWKMAVKNGEYAVVYRIISTKQKVKWIETFGDVLLDTDGNFVRALGIVRDITEQKEAEIKMVALAKFLKRSQKIGHLGSWTIKANSTFIEINEEAKVMFGLSEEKYISLDRWITIIHADDRNRVWQAWSKATEGKGDYDLEYRIIVNNSTRWVKAVAELEFDSEGMFIQAVGIVKEITEQVTQQENLRIARDQAEVANKLKSQFLANMSHEIRTPLNGVIGFSELLMKTPLSETQEHYMKTLNQSAHNLIGIINNILDFSKIEAGKLELFEEKADLFELINYAKNIISFQAQEKNIDLWVKIASNVPQYVTADGLRLQQVLVNLMNNAVKFTNQGEIELSVGLLKTNSKAGSTFRFSIRDTGIGISTENQSKIFEAFAQEDISTTKKFGGTGLGLSISNGILALMDSHIQLESEIGKGSQFYFDIFLKPYQEDPDNSNIPSNEIKFKEDLSIEKDLKSLVIKILVVEDSQVNMLLAQALIRSLLPKATILKALDGRMAVEIFEIERPDLILMDIQMPVLNGLDATKKIREIESRLISNQEGYQRIPIIAITAGILKEEKINCLAAGMDDFLAKPIINEVFISSIKRWVLH